MEDKRCCGRGVCIINIQGICWCGQKWDGDKMISVKAEAYKTKNLEKNESSKK